MDQFVTSSAPGPNRRRRAFLTCAVLCVLAIAAYGTHAAFIATTANTGNQITAGTVALSDDDAGSMMYAVSNAKPGDVIDRCITVTYSGSLKSSVGVYASAVAAFGDHVDLDVASGTAGASFPSCSGFTPDGGSVYTGTLRGFAQAHTDSASAQPLQSAGSPTWNQGASVAYRFRLTVRDDFAANANTAPLSSGSHDFTFFAKNSAGYANSVFAQSANLAGFWRLGESSGTVATDSSPAAKHGTYSGSPTLGQAGAINDPNTSVAFSPATSDQVDLNGINVTVANGTWNTVEFWMYWNGGSSLQMPFGFASYDLYLGSGRFGFNTGNGDVRGRSSTGLSGRWVHIAAEFYNGDATQSRLWVDGQEQSLSQLVGTPNPVAATSTARISGWRKAGPSYPIDGRLDEVAVYNRALTDSEIKSHYDAR